MFGLEFSLAAAINAVAGGLIGAGVSLAVALYLARKEIQRIRSMAAILAEIATAVTDQEIDAAVDEEGKLHFDEVLDLPDGWTIRKRTRDEALP